MANPNFKMIFKDRIAPEKGGYPGFNPRTIKDQGMIIEYNVPVTMRDGTKIYTDVFRPDVNAYRPDPKTKYPVLVAWGPYGKHGCIINGAMTNCGLDDRQFSKYSIYEGPDPVYWCQNGYIVLNPDRGGSGVRRETRPFSVLRKPLIVMI